MKRTRKQVIESGDWEKLTIDEKVKGMLEFSEGDYDSSNYGSLEDFIVTYHRERLSEKTSDEEEATV